MQMAHTSEVLAGKRQHERCRPTKNLFTFLEEFLPKAPGEDLGFETPPLNSKPRAEKETCSFWKFFISSVKV